MTPGEQSALTRLRNNYNAAKAKWLKNPSPYLAEKMTKAKKKLDEKLNQLLKPEKK